jgi:hypothetical protein
VSETRLLKRIFGPRRNEVTEGCRQLNNEIAKHNWNRQVKKDDIGWARSMNWDQEECIYVTSEKEGRKETTRKTKT